MRLTFCVACGSRDDLQQHHLVTREEGGTDHESNLITLCCDCHLQLHERQRRGQYNASERTKAGIAAARARGAQIGGYREPGVLCKDGRTISKGTLKLGPEHREAARRVRKAASERHAQELAPTIADLRSQGVTSLRRLALALEERGVLTASKKDSRWTPMQVSRVLAWLEPGKGDTTIELADIELAGLITELAGLFAGRPGSRQILYRAPHHGMLR